MHFVLPRYDFPLQSLFNCSSDLKQLSKVDPVLVKQLLPSITDDEIKEYAFMGELYYVRILFTFLYP